MAVHMDSEVVGNKPKVSILLLGRLSIIVKIFYSMLDILIVRIFNRRRVEIYNASISFSKTFRQIIRFILSITNLLYCKISINKSLVSVCELLCLPDENDFL